MLTIREVIKICFNALLQRLKKHRGNWDQNDPSADDYIKNRPFYTDDSKKETVVKTINFTAESPYWWGSPFAFTPVVGETYKVTFDGKEYICQSYLAWGDCGAIGNISINDDGPDTGEPFFYFWYDSSDYGLCVRNQGNHTITIEKINVKKLDKRYLPDLGLAPVATSGNYWDLEDVPETYTDVVRYNVSQSLTTAQKKTVRTNIGAVGYDTAHNLTTSQKLQARGNICARGYEAQTLTIANKTQARTNIGAVGYEAQTLTDTQKTQARTNIGAVAVNDLAPVATSGSYNDLADKPDAPIHSLFNSSVGSDQYIYGANFLFEQSNDSCEVHEYNFTESSWAEVTSYYTGEPVYKTTLSFTAAPLNMLGERIHIIGLCDSENTSNYDVFPYYTKKPTINQTSMYYGLAGNEALSDYPLLCYSSDSFVSNSGGSYLLCYHSGNRILTLYSTTKALSKFVVIAEKPRKISESHIPSTIARTEDIPSIEGLATEEYVDTKVADLVNAAPETLDTLNELSAALGNDPNFATTVLTQLGNKADKDDIPVIDTTLTVEGAIADAKAVGDAIAEATQIITNERIDAICGGTIYSGDEVAY